MVTEHGLLSVRAGQEAAFEAAFAEARDIIAASPGFRGLVLSRGVERPATYLLRVEWETLADHEEGFRGSTAYLPWAAALHHFYEPMPRIEHFETVHTA